MSMVFVTFSFYFSQRIRCDGIQHGAKRTMRKETEHIERTHQNNYMERDRVYSRTVY
jgi:hypothetical protein